MASNEDKDGWEEVPISSNDGWEEVPISAPKNVQQKVREEFYRNRDPFKAKAEAIWRGAGQGGTAGFSDELLGAGKGAFNYVGKKLSGQDAELLKEYLKARDLERSRNEMANIAEPSAYKGGEMIGSLATGLVPGVGGGSLAAQVAKGAGQGALASYGYGETTKPDLSNMAAYSVLGGAVPLLPKAVSYPVAGAAIGSGVSDIAGTGADTGALAGGALGLGAGLASGVVRANPKAIADFAEARALKAATGQNKKAIKDLARANMIDETGAGQAGRALLQKDETGKPLLGWLDSSRDVYPKTKAKSAEIWDTIQNEIGNKLDEKNPKAVLGSDISGNLMNFGGKIPENVDTQGIRDATMERALNFDPRSFSFADAQAQKNSLKYSPVDPKSYTTSKDVVNATKAAIGRAQDQAVERNLGPEAQARYKQLKGQYGPIQALEVAGADSSAGNISNRLLSPSDYAVGEGLGIAELAKGNPAHAALAIPAAVGHKLIRERGSAFAARSADAMANLLAKYQDKLGPYAPILQKAAAKGNDSLALTTYLLEKNDPAFANILNSISTTENQGEVK